MKMTRIGFGRLRGALAFGLCLLLILSTFLQAAVTAQRPGEVVAGVEEKGNVRKVSPVPPRTGPPAGNLPNLDQIRHAQPAPVRTAEPITSTMRSRHKPLESRGGRTVNRRSPGPRRSHHARHASKRALSATSATMAMTLTFSDDPLSSGVDIKALHITELRAAIDQARGRAGLANGSWAEAVATGVSVKASHITEMRSNLDEARGLLGFSTGGYTDPNLGAGYWIKKDHIQELRDRVREVVDVTSSDQYVANFLQWALGRTPTGPESTYWTDIIRAAYPHGLSSMKLAMRELGMTVFESAEYAARNRNDHWYVYDLYKTFLMRDPDAGGWANWEAAVPIYGREQVRRAFDESTEFGNIVAALNASGSPSAAVSSLATARVDPFNQSGNQLQARDAEWGASLISLPGRAGLDLGLGLSYSSLVWTNSGPYMYFDADKASLSPGFHIGFPTIQDKYFDARVGRNVYLLKTAAGSEVELRQVGTSNTYESADSSYLQLTYGGNLTLRTTDGTQMTFGWSGLNEYRCTSILDRNGNYMIVNYDWRGDIQNVTDTLGRVIKFVYDVNSNLACITQGWNGQPAPTTCDPSQPHVWASFGWENVTMQPGLTGVVGTFSGEVIPMLKMVGFHDSTYVKFLYNGNGQVERVTQYASDSNPLTDNHARSYTDFDYNSPTNDCPRLTASRVWAEYWTGVNDVPSEVTTQFGVEGDKHTVSVVGDPNGTIYKEAYAGSADPSWMRGLVKSSEVWSAGVQRKLSTLAWTQDNPNLNYKTNPRVIETNVYDSAGNRRRTTIDYSVAAYAQYGLPYFVREFAADATTPLRTKYFDYNLAPEYLERRIIGLVDTTHVFDHVSGNYVSKVHLSYDWDNQSNTYLIDQGTATQHDNANYGASFRAGRGNLCAVRRWNVNAINDWNQGQWISFTGYNTHGSVIFTADALGRENRFSYSDSFSAGGVNLDAPRSFSTFAYPTTITDADGFSSTSRYRYDFGAKTRVEGPPPQNQPNGIIQTFAYDSAARLQRTTTANTGAYTHNIYGSNYVQSYSSVNTVAQNYLNSDFYNVQVFDGAGRVFNAASYHPGSVGGYRAVNTIYDRMGRAVQQSNPTEITGNWVPAGDDAYNAQTGEGGWRYTQQSYNWQGQLLRTTHPDGYYKEASYSGCGCAGGEVVTLTDEVGRRQKVYSDVLGRQWKDEILNWDSSVYSATTNTFNARDQVKLVRQWAGAEGSGAYQDTTMSYDGYGRLQTKHVPEQNAGTATVYAYNADDTVLSVTDARGASATYGYNNNRRLVTSIDYTAPYGVAETPDVTFGYDAAGNRTSMTDGLGGVSYTFDSLSRLTSETRTFNGVGNYTLSYDYNLAGEVNSITDPFGGTLSYGRDALGRLNSVNGTGYGEVSQFASNIQYRAWGGLKSTTYSPTRSVSISYNTRMLPTLYQIIGQSQTSGTEYQYNADGRISSARDLIDPIFDRSYAYDHMKRLTQAFSGSEARGGSSPDGPYRQTYSFDTFSNLTERTGRDWSHTSAPVSFSYNATTNRNPQWQYDADGRVTAQGNRSYSYNAAGKQTRAGEGSAFISHDFDGDGFRVKSTPNLSWADYYLRSTVLNGEIVAELDPQGQYRYRYIYANGGLLAQQYDTGWITWKHRNPSNNTEWVSFGNASFRQGEYDPLGTNLGTYDPYLEGGGGEYGHWTGGFGVPSDLTTGCAWEGMAIGCQYAVKFLGMRGYLSGSRLKITTNLPGAREYSSQISHVKSSAVPWGEEPQWSEGDITVFRDVVPTPDTTQTEIVRRHHGSVQRRIDPKLKQAIEDCAKELYGVTAKGAGFTPTRRGQPGSFEGSRVNSNGQQEEVFVVNENRAYTGAQLAILSHKFGGPALPRVEGLTIGSVQIGVNYKTGEVSTRETGYSPYRNFSASDLKGVSWVGIQAWEFGNSLSMIIGQPYQYNPRFEPGKVFTDCVRKKYGSPIVPGTMGGG